MARPASTFHELAPLCACPGRRPAQCQDHNLCYRHGRPASTGAICIGPRHRLLLPFPGAHNAFFLAHPRRHKLNPSIQPPLTRIGNNLNATGRRWRRPFALRPDKHASAPPTRTKVGHCATQPSPVLVATNSVYRMDSGQSQKLCVGWRRWRRRNRSPVDGAASSSTRSRGGRERAARKLNPAARPSGRPTG
jgi:hypothetical protein